MQGTPILHDIRILDFTQLIAGPSATAMLAELGADVIKIEAPEGDISRRMGMARLNGISAPFAAYNRGKKSICLDLRTPEGLEVAKRLAGSADVLIEAFRPGVLDRLGLGYETVKALQPDIVYVSFSGFGADGPMTARPGVDLLAQAESGIMSITGEEDGPPLKIGFTAVDAAAGFALSQAILTGLLQKLRKGCGCRICVSLLDVALYMQASPLTEYLMSGVEPCRMGNTAPLGSPAEMFRTSDGTLIVSAYFPNQWPVLCRILGLEELIEDPRFSDNEARIRNRTVLHALLQARFETRTSAEWKELLTPTRVIFGEVLSYRQVIEHPQVAHNASIVPIEASEGTVVKSVAPPWRIESHTSFQTSHLPHLGEHGREVLAGCGYTETEIDTLIAAGALFLPPTKKPLTAASSDLQT